MDSMFSYFLNDPQMWDAPLIFRTTPMWPLQRIPIEEKAAAGSTTAITSTPSAEIQPGFNRWPLSMDTMPRHPFVNLDFAKQGDQYLVNAEVPGMTKDDIKVHVDGRNLTISGEKKSVIEEGAPDTNYYRRETSSGSFSRSVLLPDDANMEGLKAGYEHGKLNITIPQMPAKAKRTAKQITIE
jgi:HSP20 family molecular chaperone IbpA